MRKGDEDRFFRLTYWYLSKKFGIENMMGGYVHKDEVLKDGTPARDTCCAMRSGRRMRGTATTLHRRGRIAGRLDDVL